MLLVSKKRKSHKQKNKHASPQVQLLSTQRSRSGQACTSVTGRSSATTTLIDVWVNTDSKGAFDESDSKRPNGGGGDGAKGGKEGSWWGLWCMYVRGGGGWGAIAVSFVWQRSTRQMSKRESAAWTVARRVGFSMQLSESVIEFHHC